MKKRQLILDCDPGRDDAIAIMMLGRNTDYELLGITTVAGNHTVDHTWDNAKRLCAYLDIPVGVYRGCEGPLLRDPVIAPEIHGETGLDGFSSQKQPEIIQREHAVGFLTRTLLAAEVPVTLLVTGPMTNIAMALRLEPSIRDHIERIVFMGGSMALGNVTPAAEFNIFADPEAADIVMKSGCPLYMAGIDVTMQALCGTDTIARMGQHKNVAGKLFTDLMVPYCEAEKSVYGTERAPLHDPVAATILLKPELLTFRQMHVSIDCTRQEGYGRTYCDYYHVTSQKPNCYVAEKLDTEGFWDLVEEKIKAYTE